MMMMMKRLARNPWLVFLPFLFYYAYVVVKNKWPTLYGDELRYVYFAKNMLHGFYSPSPPHINLWNGPGYPIILIPFVALNIPALYMTLMNAVYQYLAVVFLYKALKLVSNAKIAIVGGLLLALYPNALSMLPILYTEAFTTLLVSAFIYAITIYSINEKNKYAIIAGVILGYLILTKIIFGSVIIISLGAYLIWFLFKRNRTYLRPLKILTIAFAICIPYLAYTYYMTGKAMYWGNSGGMSLYWMSTPYEQEYGDWKLPELTNKQYPTSFKSVEVVAILKKNHSAEIKAILKHNELEQDELFKQAAINNIKKNPAKFLKNYYYNFSRMLFNFPYSYSYQDAGIVQNILIGSLTLWASIIGIIITALNWRRIVFSVKFIILVTVIYLMLSGALSAYPRQLNIIIPALIFWLGFLIANIKKADLKFPQEENLDDIELTDLAGIDGVSVKGL